MTRAFIIGSLVMIGFANAQAQSLDDPRGGAIELNPGSEMTEPVKRISRSSQSGSQVTVGRKAAEKYMSQEPEESAASPYSPRRSIAMAADDHYLALHFGRFFSDNAYLWGPDKEDNIGNWNIGVTYRIGEWVNSMDLTLRIDLSQYSPDDAKATKLSFMPLITFPDASSRFPLYFGAGMGLGAFVNQIGKESSLSLDYQLVGGVRFFEIFGTTGFFVEGGIKNHLFLLSDGQFNGAFMAVGTVFTF